MAWVSVRTLLDSCTDIADKSWVNSLASEDVVNDFVWSVSAIIETAIVIQVHWKEILQSDQEVFVPESTQVSVATLLDISRELDETILEDSIYTNFIALLESNDEVEMFDTLAEIYDNFWITEVQKQIKRAKLFTKVPQESHLYPLLQMLMEWKEITPSLVMILETVWINPVNNPPYRPPVEIENFLNNFKDHLLWLVSQSTGTSFYANTSHALN